MMQVAGADMRVVFLDPGPTGAVSLDEAEDRRRRCVGVGPAVACASIQDGTPVATGPFAEVPMPAWKNVADGPLLGVGREPIGLDVRTFDWRPTLLAG
jgi:hypothetical protein